MSFKIKIFTIAVFMVTSLLVAKEISPNDTIRANGSINDMFVKNGRIYISTDSGTAQVFDLKTKKSIKNFKFKQIKDFMGDLTDVNVYSVDINSDRYMFVLQGESGHTRVLLIKDGKKEFIINDSDALNIMKAKFISKDLAIFGLMSSELILYDLKNRKVIYDKQISQMKFADFKLNEDKSKLALSDEGGDIKIVDVKTGKVLHILSGQNKDNVYQVDFKADVVATAGKDKKCAVYNLKTDSSFYKGSNFIVYSVGLSSDGKMCGYQSSDKNEVTIFSTSTKDNLYTLKGGKSFVTNIIFLDNSNVITSAKDKIKFWNLKGEKK